MLLREHFASSVELKFVGEPDAGMIEGYGSVFGVQDTYGDQVEPGAFDATLAEHKSAGTMPFMYGEHSAFMVGGDPYPIGMWTGIEPDEKGLKMTGQLIALDHPDVSRVRQLVLKGALRGLSIAWSGREGGITRGTKAGDPKRWLKSVNLYSVDLVSDPANRQAKIDGMKAMIATPNTQSAAEAIAKAHRISKQGHAGGNSPTRDQRTEIDQYLQDAHKKLTGQDIPDDMKMAFDQLRELKKWLHLPLAEGGRGFSNSQADEIAELVFKSMPRDESGDTAATARALREIGSALSGFTLKSGD